MDHRARYWHGSTVLFVCIGLEVALHNAAVGPSLAFHSAIERILNEFAYFTEQANIIVAITAAVLIIGPHCDTRLFRYFRFMGIVDIVVTAFVYHFVLAPGVSGFNTIDGLTLHTIVPLLAVITWLVYGPRHLVTPRIAWVAVLYPTVWLVLTLIRGKIVGWYPYGFVNATQHGYGAVFRNSLVLAFAIGIIIWILFRIDRMMEYRKP